MSQGQSIESRVNKGMNLYVMMRKAGGLRILPGFLGDYKPSTDDKILRIDGVAEVALANIERIIETRVSPLFVKNQ